MRIESLAASGKKESKKVAIGPLSRRESDFGFPANEKAAKPCDSAAFLLPAA
jgi:hypothetical protein